MMLWPLTLGQVWCFFYPFFNVTVWSRDCDNINRWIKEYWANRETLNLCYYADNNLCPNTTKTKELIIDVRRKAFTHHPIPSMALRCYCPSLGHQIAHVKATSSDILLNFHCCSIESILTNGITVGYGNYWEPEIVADRGENLPRLLIASLEHHFLLLETSKEKAQRPLLMTPTCRQLVALLPSGGRCRSALTTHSRFRNPSGTPKVYCRSSWQLWLISSCVGFDALNF